MPEQQLSAQKHMYHKGAALWATSLKAGSVDLCQRSEGPCSIWHEVHFAPPSDLCPLPLLQRQLKFTLTHHLKSSQFLELHLAASSMRAMSRLYHAYREHYHAEVRCCTALAELRVTCLVTGCSARFSLLDPPGELYHVRQGDSHSKVRCRPCMPPCINCHELAAPRIQGPMPCQRVLAHKAATLSCMQMLLQNA